MKDALINARIESELKMDVESILKKIGLSATQAITLYYQQIKLNKGIPFEVKIPNNETLEAMKRVDSKDEALKTFTLGEIEEFLNEYKDR